MSDQNNPPNPHEPHEELEKLAQPHPDSEFQQVAMEELGHGPTGPVKLSHPPGLALLFVTEMWERFSYYGMRGLLVLFLIAEVSGNGIGGSGGGFGLDRSEAGKIYGWYTSLVYLLPVFGGMLADKLIGTHRSMVIGGIIIALGHGALGMMDIFHVEGETVSTMQQVAFYSGLGLIIIGTGFFKPCVSVMVGQLYEEGDPRRDAGFTIFYMGINAGAVGGGILCGALATKYGWWAGFGAAGVGMVLGLIVYIIGRPKLLKGIGLPPKDHDPAMRVIGKILAAMGGLAIPVAIYALLGILAKTPVDARPSWLQFASSLEPGTAEVFKLGFFVFLIAAVLVGVVWFTMAQEKHERGPTAALFIIALFVIFFWYAFEQAGSSMNVFAQQRTDRIYALHDADGVIESKAIGEKWKGLAETTFGELHATIGDGGGAHGGGGAESGEEKPQIIAARKNPYNVGAGIIHVHLKDGSDLTFNINPETTVAELAANMAAKSDGSLTLAENDDQDGVIITDTTQGKGTLIVDERGAAARDLRILSAKEFPATWYQSVNPTYILLFAPVFAIAWVKLAKRGLEPSTPVKMAYGLLMLGLGFVFMVVAAKSSDSGVFMPPNATESADGAHLLVRVAPYWLALAYLLHTWGELCLSPIGLSLTTKLAPKKWVSFMMGVWFLSPSIAQLIGGYTFAYIEPIEAGDAAGFPILGGQADFFLIFIITSVGAGLVLLLISPIMKKLIGGRG